MVTASANGAHRGENHRLRSKSEPAGHPTVSLIIPTLNEAENLRYVLPTLPSVVDELVIVDGGSTDGTVGVVRQLQPNATIVHEPRPGKGVALQSGFEAARGEILVMMDADGSMDPNDIATFVAALLAGADVAKGSRFLQGGGSSDLTPLRTLGNFMLTRRSGSRSAAATPISATATWLSGATCCQRSSRASPASRWRRS